MTPSVYAVLSTRPPEEWRPIAHVSNRSAPALLVHGLEDGTIHPGEAVHMAARLREVGVPVECRIYQGAGHLAPLLAMSPLLRFEGSTLADVRDFIDRTVTTGAPSKAGTNGLCPSVSGRRSWEHPLPQPYLWEVP
jgi:acetyl esterase/lipase